MWYWRILNVTVFVGFVEGSNEGMFGVGELEEEKDGRTNLFIDDNSAYHLTGAPALLRTATVGKHCKIRQVSFPLSNSCLNCAEATLSGSSWNRLSHFRYKKIAYANNTQSHPYRRVSVSSC